MELVDEVWQTYTSARDRGHTKYVDKANRCESFFRGDQWLEVDKSKLGDRPAFTVNMVLATMATAFGQMIENFSEVTYYSKDGRYEEKAKALQLVTKHIYQETKEKWKELDMAMDGFITGRGFLDVRMQFGENLRGDVTIEHLDPRDVLIDPEAKTCTPEGWKEVFISRWLTIAEIEVLYGKAKAEKLKNRNFSSFGTVYDRVTTENLPGVIGGEDAQNYHRMPSSAFDDAIPRRFRVVEKQWKKLSTKEYFLDQETGETRPIPDNWDQEKVDRVINTALDNQVLLTIIDRKVERIRRTIVAADVMLHDDWSPYDTFTVVPFFPYFRWGKTMGVVENLLDLQEGLNKVFSQTLHIINTTANSGWKVKAGSLVNMTIEELEERGAETGLVVELTNVNDIEKITANGIPQGLDRIATQMGDWVKYVSGISDSMRGFDRSDVAAKAIVAKQQAGAISLAVPFESLNRTRTYMAEVILKMIQRFYTEPRVLRIAPIGANGQDESVEINKPTGSGLVNDITVGQYGVRVSTVPPTDRHQESQYQRAVELRNAGVNIPDWAIVDVAGLSNRAEIIEALNQSQEAQAPQQELEAQLAQTEVALKQAEADAKAAQASVLRARVQEIGINVQGLSPKDAKSREIVQMQSDVQREKLSRDDDFRYRKLALDTLSKQPGVQNGRANNGSSTDTNAGNGDNTRDTDTSSNSTGG